VGPRVGLDVMAKRKNCCHCQESNPSRPTNRLVSILTEHPIKILFACLLIFFNSPHLIQIKLNVSYDNVKYHQLTYNVSLVFST
jgi:hypothetical protein